MEHSALNVLPGVRTLSALCSIGTIVADTEQSIFFGQTRHHRQRERSGGNAASLLLYFAKLRWLFR